MEGFVKVKSINSRSAFSLMEVMISMVIFSILLVLSGKLVSLGMQRPFVYQAVEDWTNFMELTHQRIQQLSANDILLNQTSIDQPFKDLEYPSSSKQFRLTWEKSSIPEFKVAIFTLTTDQGKTFEWKSFKRVQ